MSVTFTNVYVFYVPEEEELNLENLIYQVFFVVFFFFNSTWDGITYATQALSGIKSPMKTKLF